MKGPRKPRSCRPHNRQSHASSRRNPPGGKGPRFSAVGAVSAAEYLNSSLSHSLRRRRRIRLCAVAAVLRRVAPRPRFRRAGHGGFRDRSDRAKVRFSCSKYALNRSPRSRCGDRSRISAVRFAGRIRQGLWVEVLPIEGARPALGMREEDWPTTDEGIAALLARMDQVEPGWLSPEDDAAWRRALRTFSKPAAASRNAPVRSEPYRHARGTSSLIQAQQPHLRP